MSTLNLKKDQVWISKSASIRRLWLVHKKTTFERGKRERAQFVPHCSGKGKNERLTFLWAGLEGKIDTF